MTLNLRWAMRERPDRWRILAGWSTCGRWAIFGFGEKKNKFTINRVRALAAVPLLNRGLEIEKDEAGNTIIRVKVRRGRGFLSRFQPPVMIKTVKLDEIGTFVLDQVNEEATVLDIVNSFVARFKTNRREAELSTVDFFKSLMQKGIISMAVK